MYNKDSILLFGYHLVSSCELADGNVQPDKQNGDFPRKKGEGGKVDVQKKSKNNDQHFCQSHSLIRMAH